MSLARSIEKITVDGAPASAIQSPLFFGHGKPRSTPNMTSMPARPKSIASTRGVVIASPSTIRASSSDQTGVV